MGINGTFTYVSMENGATPADIARAIEAEWRARGLVNHEAHAPEGRIGLLVTLRTKLEKEWQQNSRFVGVAISPVSAGWCAIIDSSPNATYRVASLSRRLRIDMVFRDSRERDFLHEARELAAKGNEASDSPF